METVSFATARRGCDPDALKLARAMLHKGYGFQNAARISGVNEADLRAFSGSAPRRVSVAVPKSRSRPLKPRVPALFEPACADETTAILNRVAARYGLTRRDLTGASRVRIVAWARQEAMATVRKERPHLSYPAIARIFAGRDHTTIMHGEARHLERAAWCEVLAVFANLDPQSDLFAVAA